MSQYFVDSLKHLSTTSFSQILCINLQNVLLRTHQNQTERINTTSKIILILIFNLFINCRCYLFYRPESTKPFDTNERKSITVNSKKFFCYTRKRDLPRPVSSICLIPNVTTLRTLSLHFDCVYNRKDRKKGGRHTN